MSEVEPLKMSKLYLIPNTLNQENFDLLPASIAGAISSVRAFFVEEPKSARRLLRKLNPSFPLEECHFYDLDEHTAPKQLGQNLEILQRMNGGIISEAGLPCVADPGSDLVLMCHQQGIEVVPLVGPSSILMALMASGLNGQNFAFNGYLPKDSQERRRSIKKLQERSFKEKQTQIFMETPYRNQHLLEDILAVCASSTHLCVACDMASAHQIIKTMTIKEWRKKVVDINKKPAMFLIDTKCF